jgi:hypothetical protein
MRDRKKIVDAGGIIFGRLEEGMSSGVRKKTVGGRDRTKYRGLDSEFQPRNFSV